MSTRSVALRVLQIAVLAFIYAGAARLGLRMDAVSGFATLVWPPSGVAVAALLLFGPRLWPGVALGAFLANVLTGAPPLVAAAIACGNTLEAVVGARLFRGSAVSYRSLTRLTDAVRFILVVAVLSTTVSATIGVAALSASGLAPWAEFIGTWRAWWIGDLIGILVVAPLVLVWAQKTARPLPRRLLTVEAAGAVAAVSLASAFVFGGDPPSPLPLIGQPYLVFPPLLWAALRFGSVGAVSGTFVVSAIAVAGTAFGHGPFAADVLHEGLLRLQVFMSTVAITMLLLGAAMSERT